MFQYGICTEPDEDIFYRQCKALEKRFPGMKKEELLEDVDGTLIQGYIHPAGEITVRNDFYVGAVWVESEFDLRPYFKK